MEVLASKRAHMVVRPDVQCEVLLDFDYDIVYDMADDFIENVM